MANRKELIRQYKETLPPMGVYKIVNLANGMIFVGSGKNLHGKRNSYRFQLDSGTHYNTALQRDYNQFGCDNFTFEIIDYLEPKEGPGYDYTDDLAALEEMWLEKLQPYGDKGYNKKK